MRTNYLMQQTMRWFGPIDPVLFIRYTSGWLYGCSNSPAPSSQWSCLDCEEIMKRKNEVEAAGMIWSVVESVPVHEAIKTQAAGFEEFIENYQQSIRNLATCGIQIVTYNFMPVLD